MAELPDGRRPQNTRRQAESSSSRASHRRRQARFLRNLGCRAQQAVPARRLRGFLSRQEFGNIGWGLKDGLPYQPWAREIAKKRSGDLRKDDPLSHCLPIGVVELETFPMYRKVVQTPGLLVILNEYNASYRQIFTDGRPLPVDPKPSWNGYSPGSGKATRW